MVGAALGFAVVGEDDGGAVGDVVGAADGAVVGADVGVGLGGIVGVDDGAMTGAALGAYEGPANGAPVGVHVGVPGIALGEYVGAVDGAAEGLPDGTTLGLPVGAVDGAAEGLLDGTALGLHVGPVGAIVGDALGCGGIPPLHVFSGRHACFTTLTVRTRHVPESATYSVAPLLATTTLNGFVKRALDPAPSVEPATPAALARPIFPANVVTWPVAMSMRRTAWLYPS